MIVFINDAKERETILPIIKRSMVKKNTPPENVKIAHCIFNKKIVEIPPQKKAFFI